MKYVACYSRVSTSLQGSGLEAQVRAMNEYCKVNGIQEFRHFSDEGISGARETRPGLDALMEAVKTGEVSTVIVYSFSRFARSTRFLLSALEHFNSKGISFVSLSEQINTATTTGQFVFSILASVSQLERELIRERVRNGLKNARAKGKVLGRIKQFKNTVLVHHLHSQGLPYKEIARLAGCSSATVCRELKVPVQVVTETPKPE